MTEMSATELQSVRMSALPEISPATNDVIAYLRHSYKIAEIAVLAEREAWLLVSAISSVFLFLIRNYKRQEMHFA